MTQLQTQELLFVSDMLTAQKKTPWLQEKLWGSSEKYFMKNNFDASTSIICLCFYLFSTAHLKL